MSEIEYTYNPILLVNHCEYALLTKDKHPVKDLNKELTKKERDILCNKYFEALHGWPSDVPAPFVIHIKFQTPVSPE